MVLFLQLVLYYHPKFYGLITYKHDKIMFLFHIIQGNIKKHKNWLLLLQAPSFIKAIFRVIPSRVIASVASSHLIFFLGMLLRFRIPLPSNRMRRIGTLRERS